MDRAKLWSQTRSKGGRPEKLMEAMGIEFKFVIWHNKVVLRP